MEGKGKVKVSSDGGCCLVVDEGRYLAYNSENGKYYLSEHPQPIKGGRAVRSWYGARRFVIDDGSGDSVDKVAVGILHNGGGKVLVAGDRIKGEAVVEEPGAEVLFITPFLVKCPREKPENVSYAKAVRDGFSRLNAQLLEAGYKDDDGDVDLETYFPDDIDFYVKFRDSFRNRLIRVGIRHFMDHDIEDSGDEDDEFELPGEDYELLSSEEVSDEEEDSEDDEEEDDDDDDDDGEDDESHKDKQSICRNRQVEETHNMDQDMEDSEDMNDANIRDIEPLCSQ